MDKAPTYSSSIAEMSQRIPYPNPPAIPSYGRELRTKYEKLSILKDPINVITDWRMIAQNMDELDKLGRLKVQLTEREKKRVYRYLVS